MRADQLAKLLDQEIEVCRDDATLSSGDFKIWRDAGIIYVRFESGRDGKPGVFRLDCEQFDAQPPAVAMADAASLAELPQEAWTTGVSHGIHPATGKPFVCLQGTAEYHSHPSHQEDSWDRYRNTYRLRQTITNLLRKAGAI
jgi:hypothetical protein